MRRPLGLLARGRLHDPSRVLDILFYLLDQLVHAREALLRAKPLDELDLAVAAVEVAGEVEQVYFERSVDAVKRWTYSEVRRAAVGLVVHSEPHCIHAVRR